MGMDVYGVNPLNETGEYFRASCWSWRPIHNAICNCEGEAILGSEAIEGIGFNQGDGATTSDQCEKLANRLEQYIENIEGDVYSPEEFNDSSCQVNSNGVFVSSDYKGVTRSPYYTDKGHLKEFVTFLRNCGEGFEVW